MKTTTKKNKGLKNPAVAAAASGAADKAVRYGAARAKRGQETAVRVAEQVLPWMIKLAVVGVVGYVAYRVITNRFKKASYRSDLDPANITDAQAQNKATAIYNAMYGYGANVQVVGEQLIGLNYNGWIKLYNAFGKREPWNLLGEEMTIVEWFNDQFDEEEMQLLRAALPGVF